MTTTASVRFPPLSPATYANQPLALKPNSTNVVVSNLFCNGSHGVSIGSLGQVRSSPVLLAPSLARWLMARGQYAGKTDIVANVSVTNVSMNNAQNGARIKVFGGSPDSGTSTHPRTCRVPG